MRLTTLALEKARLKAEMGGAADDLDRLADQLDQRLQSLGRWFVGGSPAVEEAVLLVAQVRARGNMLRAVAAAPWTGAMHEPERRAE